MKERVYLIFRSMVAPEFATMTDEQLDIFFEEAEIEIPALKENKLYPRMIALLMAHAIAIGEKAKKIGGAGQIGQVKRTKVGDLEREYAVSGSSGTGEVDLETTSYGLEFLRLRKKIMFTPRYIV